MNRLKRCYVGLLLVGMALNLRAQPSIIHPQEQKFVPTGFSNLRVRSQSADGTEAVLTVEFAYDGFSGPSARVLPVITDKKQPKVSRWFGANPVTISGGRGTISLRVKFFNDEPGVPAELTTDHVNIIMLSDVGNAKISEGRFAQTIKWGNPNAPSAKIPAVETPIKPPNLADEKARQQAEAQRLAEEKAKAGAELKAREEARLRAEAEEKARQESVARQLAEDKAKAEAEARLREEARLKAEADAKAREEARLQAEAEEKARQAAQANQIAEEKAKAEAAAKASEQARLKAEADEKARQEAVAKHLADEKAKAEAEAKVREQARLKAEAEETAREEAEAKRIADEKAKAEEKARQEAVAKRLAEEKAQAEAEAKLREQARLKAEAEEKTRREAEAKRLADQKAQAEAAAKFREEARLKAEAAEKVRQQAAAIRLADEKAKAEADSKAREAARLKAEADAKAREEARLKAEAEEIAHQEAVAKRLAEEKTRQDAETKRLAELQAEANRIAVEKTKPVAPTDPPAPAKAPFALSATAKTKVTNVDVVNRNIERTEMTIAVEYQYAKEDGLPRMGIDIASTEEPGASAFFSSPVADLGRGNRNFVMFPVKLDAAAAQSFKRATLPTDKVWIYLTDGKGVKSYIYQSTMVLLWHLPDGSAPAPVATAPKQNTVEIDSFKQNDLFSGYVTVRYNLASGSKAKLHLKVYDSAKPATADWFACDDVDIRSGPGLQLIRIAVPKEAPSPDVFNADTVEVQMLDKKGNVTASVKKETPMSWAKPK